MVPTIWRVREGGGAMAKSTFDFLGTLGTSTNERYKGHASFVFGGRLIVFFCCAMRGAPYVSNVFPSPHHERWE